MGSEGTGIEGQKDGDPHYKAATFLIKMSPVINWKPYKMPPAPITSCKGDRRRWEVCIGGCLLCLAKEGQREKSGGKPRQELAG